MSYTVHRGDTLSSIASSHHTTVHALLQANPDIHNANLIHVGERLEIPGSKDHFTSKPANPGAHTTGAKAHTYTVHRGDTLSGIAAHEHTTVGALMKANPSIHNPSLIHVGEHLRVPGAAHKPAAHHPTTHAPAPHAPAHSGHSVDALNTAREYKGKNISYLKKHGSLARYLDKWPGNNVCCANFVSACLEKAGQIRHNQHNDSVRGLAHNLSRDPDFQKVSLRNAKPGDVVCFHVPGEGDYAHTVLFAGFKNGRPQFIGSNNANADGTQRITEGYMGYSINAIFHYKH